KYWVLSSFNPETGKNAFFLRPTFLGINPNPPPPPRYFSDLLYFETGQDIYEYFQFKRLEASKTMLLEQGCTAAAVAEKLGYSNVQQFSHIFKKITGIAPGDYRLICFNACAN
ncbi:MAG: AraC family transcriptional regulator, partial [Parabacteroides sp.]|nr:AraC family transcriptional regulator [Parabacteroides sp.]